MGKELKIEKSKGKMYLDDIIILSHVFEVQENIFIFNLIFNWEWFLANLDNDIHNASAHKYYPQQIPAPSLRMA